MNEYNYKIRQNRNVFSFQKKFKKSCLIKIKKIKMCILLQKQFYHILYNENSKKYLYWNGYKGQVNFFERRK